MIWPFSKSAPTKNGKHADKEETKTLIERLQEPDTTDLRAEEALKKSREACEQSTIMDADALIQLKNARARTNTLRKKVVKNASTILEGDENETAAERGLRELEEEEERQRARA